METQSPIVDEDAEAGAQLAGALLEDGFRVFAAGTEDSALFRFGLAQADLVVQASVRGGDAGWGWGILQRMRALSQVPIVALAEGGGEANRIESLRRGADCLLPMSVSIQELEARVNALVRRSHGAARFRNFANWSKALWCAIIRSACTVPLAV